MTKKITFLGLLLLCSLCVFSQDLKKAVQTMETKMDRFTSKTGSFSKFIDSKLPNLKSSYGSAETRVRKIIVGTESVYFYQIEKAGQYTSSTASIEYTDLLEVIKALTVLKAGVDKDVTANPDYLENKFVTVDGFQLGYYVSKGEAAWYLKLEKYGSDNTIFITDVAALDAALTEAKTKIEELKKA